MHTSNQNNKPFPNTFYVTNFARPTGITYTHRLMPKAYLNNIKYLSTLFSSVIIVQPRGHAPVKFFRTRNTVSVFPAESPARDSAD
jgi:hypothetical protein